MGGFVTGRWTYLDFNADTGMGDRWSPSMSLGLEVPFPIGPVVPGSLRLGLTYVFDTRATARTAVSLAVDFPIWTW